MKKVITLFVFVIIMRSGTSEGIEFGGYLQTDDRIAINQNHDFSWQEYRLALNANADMSDKARFYSEIWLRSWGFPAIQNSSDLLNADRVFPWNLQLREAYLDLYGFPLKNADVRIGKQRITWGTADKMNPTDNLNPDDLEDIWDFGRHTGSNGLKISYYLKDLNFLGTIIPIFSPAILPKGNWTKLLMPSFNVPAGLTIRNISDSIIQPEANTKNSSTYGLKIAKNLLGYDFSLSYVYGRDDLPMPKKITFTPSAADPGEVDMKSELFFPRTRILGLDMSGSVAGFGIWGEGALFCSEEIIMTTDLSALGLGVTDSTILKNRVYAKYVVGTDYSLRDRVYINVQYLHGFFHERGKENLEDYLLLGLEWSLLNEKLKLMPISGGLEIKALKNIKENYALIYLPEISYHPIDNAEINLGARWIQGAAATTFGKAKDHSEAYLKVKYSF